MPKLWDRTIDAHRRTVRDAILDATAALASKHGVTSVTMSQIAEETGIGRATLYKYFTDVRSILFAWHERQISAHLDHLAAIRDRIDLPGKRLEAVLESYALISYRHHGTALAGLLHTGAHVARAQRHLEAMVRDLIAAAAETGKVRTDVPANELARYCLRALEAASGLRSRTAVQRLVSVILAGLRPDA
jgi:AcrR family transcriptional regulator